MKRNILVKIVPIVVALAVCLSGCGSGGGTHETNTGPTPSASTTITNADGSVSTTRSVGNLVFTLTAPKRVYTSGERVPLTFTVQNTGTTDASSKYLYADPNALADGKVQTPSGATAAYLANVFGAGNVYSGKFVYPAGETKTFTFGWDGYDNSIETETGPPLAVAGTYKIHAFMTADNVDGQKVTQGDLGTDALEIEVQ